MTSVPSRKPVIAYTDGACRGNPGPGGWGVLLRYGDRTRELYGGELATTNNRMELMAAITALETLREPCAVTVFTDSTYVMQGLTQWLPAWKRRGWKTADRKAVKNQDLWQRLDAAAARHDIAWRWVKGHAGEPGNEAADRLANRGLDARLREPVPVARPGGDPLSSDPASLASGVNSSESAGTRAVRGDRR